MTGLPITGMGADPYTAAIGAVAGAAAGGPSAASSENKTDNRTTFNIGGNGAGAPVDGGGFLAQKVAGLPGWLWLSFLGVGSVALMVGLRR